MRSLTGARSFPLEGMRARAEMDSAYKSLRRHKIDISLEAPFRQITAGTKHDGALGRRASSPLQGRDTASDG